MKNFVHALRLHLFGSVSRKSTILTIAFKSLSAAIIAALLVAGFSAPASAVAPSDVSATVTGATGIRPAPAAVSGTAVLSVTATPVDYLTGDPITTTAYGLNGNRIAYRVAYSCSVADCSNAQVAFSPSQTDPYGLASQTVPTTLAKTLLTYESWTRPNGAPNVAPTGTDATGKSFSLGDLTAGASGTFLVVYKIEETGTYTTARAAQFYPEGFQIQMNATMSSDSAVAPATAAADPVTWSIKVPEPSVFMKLPAGAVRPGENVSIADTMGSGSFPRRGASAITGTSEWVAAGSYTVTQFLPPEAEVVSIPDGGVYNAAAHTITWVRGSQQSPDFFAAGGWGDARTTGWVSRDAYSPRNVVLKFPASNFPQADASGCNFEVSVPIRLETSVTYLDPARTTKSASTSGTIAVSCYDPFAASAISKDANNFGADGQTRLVRVPDAGQTPMAYYWTVLARNGGNVPAVAVVEDNSLGLANAPVNRIQTSAIATIEYELNTGQTGTGA